MNLLFGQTRPAFAFFNKVDGGCADASDDCQRVGRNVCSQSPPNVDYLLLGKFVPRSIFTAQVNKACSPLMFGVLRQSHPFKIFRPVVQLVAVDVIDCEAFRKSRHKGQSNKSVNKNFWTNVSKFGRNNVIAVATYPGFNFSGLANAGKRLLLAISGSDRRCNDLRSEDAGVLANKPINAFFGNGYLLHAVNGTAGHG